eukprot:9217920-Alexandrium_andersonii.AAC.1
MLSCLHSLMYRCIQSNSSPLSSGSHARAGESDRGGVAPEDCQLKAARAASRAAGVPVRNVAS